MSKTREKHFNKLEKEDPELSRMLDNLEWVRNFLNRYEHKLEQLKKGIKYSSKNLFLR